MPESKKRKKPSTTKGRTATGSTVVKKGPSPRWLAPLMLALFGIGVLWLVVFYLTQAKMGGLPFVSDISNWNLLIGFGFILAGFAVSTQWR